ncbi:MAG: hypothetical protein CL832_09580 [Crocinitomicaceae bacterium]|nr:hypothetical protein [Crocinitomicaceae bacterium]
MKIQANNKRNEVILSFLSPNLSASSILELTNILPAPAKQSIGNHGSRIISWSVNARYNG